MNHIGQKRRSTSDEYQKVWDNITDYVSSEHIEEITQKAVEDLHKVANKYKHIGYGWSGGKDSIVVQKIIERSGIPVVKGLVLSYPTEYPSTLEYYAKHTPSDCEIRNVAHPNCNDILKSNYEMMFTEDKKWTTWAFRFHWNAQKEFRKDYDIDGYITGRRLLDNNVCGKRENGFVVSNDLGDTINVIAEWTHEDVLGFIRYNHLPIPDCYFYPNSWHLGKHVWYERPRLDPNSYDKNFDELWNIDKRILLNARDELPVIERYLHERGL